MAIDLTIQRAITATQATRYFLTPSGEPGHVTKVVRAIVQGTPVPGGRREHLEAVKLGGQWVTTVEAIEDYGRRVAAASIGRNTTSPAARSRAAERDSRELDAILGVA